MNEGMFQDSSLGRQPSSSNTGGSYTDTSLVLHNPQGPTLPARAATDNLADRLAAMKHATVTDRRLDFLMQDGAMPDSSSQMRRPQFGGLPDSPGAAATPTRPSSLRDFGHSNVYRTQGSEITTFNSGLAAPPDDQFNRSFAFPRGYRDSMPPLRPSFNTQQMLPPPSNRPSSGGRHNPPSNSNRPRSRGHRPPGNSRCNEFLKSKNGSGRRVLEDGREEEEGREEQKRKEESRDEGTVEISRAWLGAKQGRDIRAQQRV
ncbi:hypothetical protein LTR22_013529 [Elasticomyces elasticus]|nr:hypothetical protein LTR22_013529 [Elasticomyces elasticus]KAK4922408.1 hypothetical protein LTR49_010273 [Elasticomyces elasticus]KAK5765289.1 hypothetical protein LTS12_004546 [Elasticomyces elasticus]